MAKVETKPEFSSILDTPSDQIEKPKPLPVGTYTAIVKGLPRFDKSSKKQTEFVEFTLQLTSAAEDVDADALDEAGGLQDRTIRTTYYLTENALWRLKEFIEHCGAGNASDTLRERIEETPNCEVGVVIKHQPSEDGTQVFANVAKTFALE